MRRRGFAVLISLIVVGVVAAIAIAGVVLLRPDHRQGAQEYAEAAARSLAAGRVPAPVDVEEGADAAAAQQRLTATLAGMGGIPHRVTVAGLTLEEGEGAGSVALDHTWTVHADKQPWTYRTSMPLRRDGDVWRGTWSNAVVAPGLAPTDRLGATRRDAPRGRITGAGGAVLVTERAVRRIGISRPETASVAQARTSARRLAALIDIDPRAYEAAVAGAGPQAFVEAIVYREPSRELAAIAGRLGPIPGATSVADARPLAPSATFAAPILGRVGEATAEIVEASKGKVRAGDTTGLGGLQSAQNDRLTGSPGFVVEAIPTDEGSPRALFEVPARRGSDVRVTLDLTRQVAAEAALAGVRPASAIVAIRPSDGHVLAAASGPGGTGGSTATLGQYAPGSTFKAVTALALLRAGLTPQTPLACAATTTVDGRVFKNYDDYPAARLGRIPLQDVVAHSCNTGLIAARDRLGPDSLAEAAGALGLTATPSLGVPAALGTVPATTGGTDVAAAEIGQGRIVSSPLGMATVAASIAAGRPVRPVLVTEPAASAPSATPVAAPVTAPEAQALRGLLRRVVTGGSATFLARAPGGPVMAKTGTAEYGTDTPPRTHAWMIAIQGDLAIAVFVADGAGGARTAGPLLADVLADIATAPSR
ncbi:penicillin-binding transpeptidase domain-containing protein [Agilicoccus flavus]|uniref:penicillin-binding transpeptidase domain-containing protein n=1 Tax=Agilicoccus flavus TaxID=2775968 RepID=UPI001CF6EFBE|nr:penicillin-binding transpeptidase domain-containing protein [Agilicoccus flavus]